MAIYDLIPYKIRVICNPEHYERPRKNIPHDIEGTCIHLDTRGSKYHNTMFKDGKILELIFSEDEGVNIWVRWDNDTKAEMYSGSLTHRSSKVAKCMSIWSPYPQHDFYTDDRPYYDLHPAIFTPRRHRLKQQPYVFTTPPTGAVAAAVEAVSASYNQPATPTARLQDRGGHRTPTIFRSIEEVPVGHPNALIKDGSYLIRIEKYTDTNGVLQIKSQVLKGHSASTRKAKMARQHYQYMGKPKKSTTRELSAQANYKHYYGGSEEPPDQFPPLQKAPPALKKAQWSERIDIPTEASSENIQTICSSHFEGIVVHNTPMEERVMKQFHNDDEKIDLPNNPFEAPPELMKAPKPADYFDSPVPEGTITSRLVDTRAPKKVKKQWGRKITKDEFMKGVKAKAKKVIANPFEVNEFNTTNNRWATTTEFEEPTVEYTDIKVKEAKPTKEPSKAMKDNLFDEF